MLVKIFKLKVSRLTNVLNKGVLEHIVRKNSFIGGAKSQTPPLVVERRVLTATLGAILACRRGMMKSGRSKVVSNILVIDKLVVRKKIHRYT